MIKDIRENAAKQTRDYKIELTKIQKREQTLIEKIKLKRDLNSYLLSCQNDFLSSSGITRVAFMIRATATISHICSKGNKFSASKNTVKK